TWTVPGSGEFLVAGATRGGRVTMQNLKLVALRQDGPQLEATGSVSRERFTSKVTKMTVEQTGPVRAVIKLDGVHSGAGRDWLPFSVRLYFYTGSDSVRIVHSFIFDGEPEQDFIAGLGVTAQVPMSDQTVDRHVRFSGEGVGVWGEAVRPVTGLRRDPGQPYKDAQVAGLALPAMAGMAKAVQDGLQWIPEWGDFSLVQLTPDGFKLQKRLRSGRAWIDVNAGARANGLLYAGGASGGVALGLKDFWQRAPVQLDVRQAASTMAEVTAWMVSPSAPAIDMRSYRGEDGMDTHDKQIAGLNITYEDYEAGWDAAHGVARTSELQLWVLGATPSHAALSSMAEQVARPARLVLAPQRIHQCAVFGDWDPVDAGTPARKLIEDRLGLQLDQYLREAEQHRWYGFWNYGDVMHAYDADRHMWRYDIGGYAWDNSELSTDLWLWYSYLRTGRADLFRFAEAMTRHTGEVDVYHLGRFKGFGTRHGVQHWSDSSKQPRVSNAAYRRIYYFLTADERVGDLMRELLDSDQDLHKVDIARKLKSAGARPDAFVGASFGTVWGSLISAWLAEWERTGDTRWRDKIVNGMRSIAALKVQWFAAGAPYDHRTGRFQGPGDKASFSNLNGVFGVVEMNSELLALVDVPAYRSAWLQYCRTYNAPKADIVALLGSDPGGRSMSDTNSRMTAYVAYHERDRALSLRAWREFFASDWLKGGSARHAVRRIDGPAVLRPVDEMSGISTNGSAQWGLAAIQHMALGADTLDEAARAAGLLR
ncbi:MAG: Tat pathway signal sequence domain protein, partial [Telluria sp.]